MRNQRAALSRVSPLILILILFTGVLPGFLFGGCTTETPSTGCRTVLNCKDDGAPICDASTLACRACRPGDDVACSNRNAQTPLCGSFGRCVGCMSNADCRDLRLPRCSSDSRCTTCQSASDCLSKVCNADGSCAPSSEVLFVDNDGGTCAGTHSGGMNDPYCSIQEAVSAAVSSNKSLIAVVPSSVPYEPVLITAVGSDGLRLTSTTGAFGSVMVRGSNVDAISVNLSGGAKPKVLISGFDVASQNGNGVNCANSDLTITTSRIHHNANGIVSSGCTLALDRLQVYRSDFNGISLNMNTMYTLTNLQVWSNYASGIVLSTGTGTMSFLTVYSNGSPSLPQAPGISCGATNNKLENSIIWRNVSQTTFAQQVAGCTAANVVTDDAMAATYGATQKTAVDFKVPSGPDPTGYDLNLIDNATNQECCIDKVQAMPGLSDHDFKGSPRPKGAGHDIGADEVR
jgi:hypothetical protein